MDVNHRLKSAIFARWPTQLDASRDIQIDSASLSLLVRNRRRPTAGQLAKLRRHFSDYKLKKIFGDEPKVEQRAEVEQVSEN